VKVEDVKTYREEFDVHYQRIFEKQHVLSNARPFSKSALSKLRETIAVEWTYNSNSIEGNTLTLQETYIVLNDGMTIHGKSMREHFETFNHHKAIQLLYKLVDESNQLTARELLNIHEIVLNNIEDEYAGRLRNGGVRIGGANFTPPPAAKVSDLIDELVLFVQENVESYNIIELVTLFHHRFVWIHPFFDGNGRTVRLAMNLIFMRAGFPPAIILKNDRKKYYEALNQANSGNYKKLLLLMIQAVERSLNIYLAAISPYDLGYKEISNIANEPTIPYAADYISLLARQGKIDAYKEGKVWYTSEEAVLNYSNKVKKYTTKREKQSRQGS
jgi:Fic family protein